MRALSEGVQERAVATRVADLPWPRIAADLNEQGWATTGPLLTGQECADLTGLYDADERFRSRVVMARHGFGQGEYRYFAYPLPPLVEEARRSAYPHLADMANGWAERLREPERFPPDLDAFLARCRAAGQTRSTPLLLKYGAGDYNRLHRDLYGELAFPLQMTVLLSEPGRDFSGGEFVLAEQRPRMQTRAEVVPLAQGEAVIFAVHHFPGRGARGFHRVGMRHGVSRLREGRRFTLGLIFHDAR